MDDKFESEIVPWIEADEGERIWEGEGEEEEEEREKRDLQVRRRDKIDVRTALLFFRLSLFY